MPKIEMKVDAKGVVTMEVSGAQGTVCSDLTRAFENELGTVTDVQQKPEYWTVMDDMQVKAHEGEE